MFCRLGREDDAEICWHYSESKAKCRGAGAGVPCAARWEKWLGGCLAPKFLPWQLAEKRQNPSGFQNLHLNVSVKDNSCRECIAVAGQELWQRVTLLPEGLIPWHNLVPPPVWQLGLSPSWAVLPGWHNLSIVVLGVGLSLCPWISTTGKAFFMPSSSSPARHFSCACF